MVIITTVTILSFQLHVQHCQFPGMEQLGLSLTLIHNDLVLDLLLPTPVTHGLVSLDRQPGFVRK